MTAEKIRIKKKPSIMMLVAISMVAPAGINIIAPSMPDFVDVFDTDYGTVQLTLSLFLVAVAFAQLVLGPLSDFFGRRPVILLGMLVSAIGSLVCIIAPSIEIFIVGRLFQGMGACAGIALARTIIRDLYDRDKAASMIGYVTMAMTVAPMAVPYIGGLLHEKIAWWGSSLFMLIFAGAVFVAGLLNLHETNAYLGKRTNLRTMSQNYKMLLSNRRFCAFSVACGFASAVYFSFMGGAPLLSSKLFGLSPTGYGLYFIMIASGYGAGSFLSGRFSEKRGVIWMIIVGTLVNLAGVFMVIVLFAAGYVHPLSLFIPVFITSFANGISLPSIIAGAVSVRPDLAGTASGITGFAQIGSGAIAATVTAEWLDINLSIWPMVIVMLIASLVAVVLSLYIRHLETIHEDGAVQIARAENS